MATRRTSTLATARSSAASRTFTCAGSDRISRGPSKARPARGSLAAAFTRRAACRRGGQWRSRLCLGDPRLRAQHLGAAHRVRPHFIPGAGRVRLTSEGLRRQSRPRVRGLGALDAVGSGGLRRSQRVPGGAQHAVRGLDRPVGVRRAGVRWVIRAAEVCR